MYNIGWAENFSGFINDEQIDIHQFAVFYHEHISERDYEYITNDKAIPSFVVSVRDNQLPHLMGLQYWSNLSVKQPEKQFQKMFDGDWDIDYLMKSDIGSWEEFYLRIEFLPFLYVLLNQADCTIRLVHQGMKSGFSRRRMDMIFTRGHEKFVYALELRGKPGEHVYFPSSLTIHKPNSKDLKIPHKIIKPIEVKITPVSFDKTYTL